MRSKVPVRQLTFLAICVAMSLLAKRFISPLTNVLTDFVRIPGGGAATAFSLMFLIIGSCNMPWRYAATTAAFVQSLLAVSMGFSVNQGMLALVTYTAPGIVIDLIRWMLPLRDSVFFVLSCGASNGVSALVSNLLIFHLTGIPFVLWMLVAVVVGVFGGLLADSLFRRLQAVPEWRQVA